MGYGSFQTFEVGLLPRQSLCQDTELQAKAQTVRTLKANRPCLRLRFCALGRLGEHIGLLYCTSVTLA